MKTSMIPFNPAGVPAALRKHPHWLVADATGKPVKTKATGNSFTTPSHWSDFDTVAKLASEGPGLWPYLVLTEGCGITCFDVDKKPRTESETEAEYEERLKRADMALESLRTLFPKRYEERSKSGNGIHIFILGTFEGTGGKGKDEWSEVEIYTGGRGIAITGATVDGNTEPERYDDGEIQAIRDRIKGGPPAETSADFDPTQDPGDPLVNLIPPQPLERVREALCHITAVDDYDTWTRVLCGLRHEFRADPEQGLELFDEWSSTGSTYDGTTATRKKWNSFKPDAPNGRPVTIGTVFDLAKKGGWNKSAQADSTGLETLNGKPAVQLPCPARPLGEFAAEVGAMLARAGVYSRGGHAFTVDGSKKRLEAVDPQWLRTWAEREVSLFKRSTGQGGETIRLRHSMSLDTAKALVVSPQFLDALPEIRRFHPVRLPVMREGGAVELLPHGFDAERLTLTDPNGCQYQTDLDPEAGKRILDDALSEFQFPDERSRAAAVSAMLTVFAGGLLPEGATVPCFVYLANAEGSGKTTLATLAGIPYGALVAKTAPTSEAEWQKRLLALTMSGQRLAILDNVRGFLNSPSLEAYLSATRYGDRILGVSKEFEGEADAVILITGNRLTMTPDMRRRSIFVELFMPELRAEDRTFRRRLDAPAMLEMQADLLAALWALVKGWDKAGRPVGSRDNASFPRWAETIGGIVECAGYACPTEPAKLENGGDTDTRDIAALGEAMEAGQRFTFAELVELCTERGLFERFTEDREEGGGDLTRKAKRTFAHALKPFHGRTVAEGKRFRIEGKGHSRRYLTENPCMIA